MATSKPEQLKYVEAMSAGCISLALFSSIYLFHTPLSLSLSLSFSLHIYIYIYFYFFHLFCPTNTTTSSLSFWDRGFSVCASQALLLCFSLSLVYSPPVCAYYYATYTPLAHTAFTTCTHNTHSYTGQYSICPRSIYLVQYVPVDSRSIWFLNHSVYAEDSLIAG